jgi:glycosyltransferase involved in cell wall biosynthesis
LEQQSEAPFEPVDPDKFARDLAKGVNDVINNKEMQKSMALKGRKRVEDTFDWSAIAQQIETLYKSLIN